MTERHADQRHPSHVGAATDAKSLGSDDPARLSASATRAAARFSAAAFIEHITLEADRTINNFQDPRQEWRRLIAEFIGTFFLVLVAAGAPMVMKAYPGTVTLAAAVVAPGLMVMSVIMFMGKVSGAHLNPAVSTAFAVRGDFPWRRVPGYVVAQLVGAIAAAFFLEGVVGVSASVGGSYPGQTTSAWAACAVEAVLTFGLVSVILGTASGAQNIGIVAAVAVGSYIALAGLWAAPLSGASMNPTRTLAPDLVGGDLRDYWVYLVGPFVGAMLAVGVAYILRGRGGGVLGSLAAQGVLAPTISRPDAPLPPVPAAELEVETEMGRRAGLPDLREHSSGAGPVPQRASKPSSDPTVSQKRSESPSADRNQDETPDR